MKWAVRKRLRSILIIAMLCLGCSLAFCTDSSEERPVLKSLFSVDCGILLRGLQHGGIGLGVQYERQIVPHFAEKGYFGHATFNSGWHDFYCTSITLEIHSVWYPLSQELRGLYFDVGTGFDYISYFDTDKKKDDYFEKNPDGMNLTTYSGIGYKFSLPKNFLLDASVGFKFTYKAGASTVGLVNDVLQDGFLIGLKIKRVI